MANRGTHPQRRGQHGERSPVVGWAFERNSSPRRGVQVSIRGDQHLVACHQPCVAADGGQSAVADQQGDPDLVSFSGVCGDIGDGFSVCG